jgi:selenocysteine-specific elongation factor
VSSPLTLGTAGHVDHGKTELVRALTGKDTDRLPQEKQRGVSIELGYAPLELPSGRRLSVVDVPGHERFVRTMVAGATGIDLFLLCVAADDGVMPQTREHLAVLRALEVTHGVVAITKTDLARPDRAVSEIAELLPGVEAVPVSTRRRAGLPELLAALERAAAAAPPRADAPAPRPADLPRAPTRLHVDRSFTLSGIGTVVTGTLWSGEVAVGGRIRLLPGGREVRVRSLQVHDAPVERAAAGQRVALALTGIRRREVRRGDVLCDATAGLRPTFVIDASIELAPDARAVQRGTRLHVHHGTRDAPARIVPLESERLEPGGAALCQLRLEGPLLPQRGDRLVLRQIAPPDTIGGGEVLDPAARKHGPKPDVLERLRAVARGAPPPAPRPAPKPAPSPEPEPLGETARRLAGLLEADGTRPRTDRELVRAAGLEEGAAGEAWRQLERAGLAARTGSNLHFHRDALDRLSERVIAICRRDGSATIARVRDELGTSRRYAQALLEHLDATKVTVRRGDRHVLRHLRGDPTAYPGPEDDRPAARRDRRGPQGASAR